MHAKPKFPKMSKDVTGPPNKIATQQEEKNTVDCEKGSPKFNRIGTAHTGGTLTRCLPDSRVINSGFNTHSGHSNVSIAACVMKRKRAFT
jgi:hypothetical protein